MSKFRKYLGLVLHGLFFVVMISSIFWLSWYWLLLVFLLLRLQDYILGGCVLTWVEFGEFRRQWIKYHFVKNSTLPSFYFALIIDWLLPLFLVVLAYFIQG